MISNFSYLSKIAEAYVSSICESFPKDVQKLLDTKYRSVYKDDGYDQFGVDINGKNRKGKPVIWRYPDKWFGDSQKLERLLKTAQRAENELMGTAKHNYDRYGFDVLGYDRQGFDIDDKDILGHSGFEYGTEEYDSLRNEREHERHNLHSKIGMREYNYSKNHTPLTQKQEQYIINAYKEAMKSAEPKREFEKKLRVLFAKPTKSGKLSFDRQAVNYFLTKYRFSEETMPNMAKREFVDKFIQMYRTQLSRMLRPYVADTYFDITSNIYDSKSGDSSVECVITAKIKRDILLNKAIRILPIVNMAKITANRMEKVIPFDGYKYWTNIGRDFVKVHLVVTDEKHAPNSNRLAAFNAQDAFEEKYGLGPYGEQQRLEKQNKRR